MTNTFDMKHYQEILGEKLKITDSIQTIKEYYEKNPRIIAINIGITSLTSLVGLIIPPIVGVVVSFIIGILSLFFVPPIIIKIKEIQGR